ncbi:conserved hypothetical protein [Paenibacillus curdlanolyticus YK9]|uniref:Uncharacterized protein n=1 Tax=Paenibacillus curdlanolyticus YK9 TaxID=717606 RepID=E0I3G6_9BACL|nr:hypothetical protein [Paenibacillus curdlanolyticus]EFM12830.1 conserved hypothetical protein [Paenibacillus curdlanolyticus YK9]
MRLAQLIQFELKRLMIPFVVMLAVTAALQLIGVYIEAKDYVSGVKQIMESQHITSFEQFTQLIGENTYSNVMGQSMWMIAPMLLCAAFMILYLFFSWYREWLGRRPFIIRLLSLPASRMNIYFAKLISFLMVLFGLVAAQLLLLELEQAWFYQLVPDVLMRKVPLDIAISSNMLLNMLVPPAFVDFVLFYGVGIAAVIVLTTIILLERSYRIVGIVVGFVYGAGIVVLFSIPFVMLIDRTSRFYPKELLAMGIGIVLLVTALSIWWSSYLLRKKITV